MLRGGLELGQVVTLRGGQAGVFQQVGHADHCIHGRANFVAHGGQEGILGLVAHLGAFTLGAPDQQHQYGGRQHAQQSRCQHSPTEREHLSLVRGCHLLAQGRHAGL